MGDGNTLANFLQFGKKYYPADRYIVAFYDHGNGWMGTCQDERYNNDVLTMREIQSAYKSVNGVDITLFTAPCLMGAVESVYELRNVTNLYIASANVSGFIYWFGVLPNLSKSLEQNPSISLNDIAGEIISSADEHKNDLGNGEDMTLSALNPAASSELVSSINEMSKYYLSHLDSLKYYFTKIQSKIYYYWPGYCDLISLVDNLLAIDKNPNATAYLQNVKTSFQKCIIAERHGENQTLSHGLNIYLPNPFTNNCLSGYTKNDNLDYLVDADWDHLLSSLQQVMGKISISQSGNPLNKGNGYQPPKK
jgi:hypothetical protein